MNQDIVAILKNPPFNETMTLFSFEEKKNMNNNDTAACLKVVFELFQINII